MNVIIDYGQKDVRLQKEVKTNDVRTQKKETAKDTTVRAVAESGVMLCQYIRSPLCSRSASVHTRTVVLNNRSVVQPRERSLS
jgi:hypothetical protein